MCRIELVGLLRLCAPQLEGHSGSCPKKSNAHCFLLQLCDAADAVYCDLHVCDPLQSQVSLLCSLIRVLILHLLQIISLANGARSLSANPMPN